MVGITVSVPAATLGADALAGASSTPSVPDAGAAGSSSSVAGVVVVAVSASGGPDVDEPLGAVSVAGPAPAAADAESTASSWARVRHVWPYKMPRRAKKSVMPLVASANQ